MIGQPMTCVLKYLCFQVLSSSHDQPDSLMTPSKDTQNRVIWAIPKKKKEKNAKTPRMFNDDYEHSIK